MALATSTPRTGPGGTGGPSGVGAIRPVRRPFVLLIAVVSLPELIGTNRHTLGDTSVNSLFARMRQARNGGWRTALVIFVIALVAVAGIALVMTGGDDPDPGAGAPLDDSSADEPEGDDDVDDDAEGVTEEIDTSTDDDPPPDTAEGGDDASVDESTESEATDRESRSGSPDSAKDDGSETSTTDETEGGTSDEQSKTDEASDSDDEESSTEQASPTDDEGGAPEEDGSTAGDDEGDSADDERADATAADEGTDDATDNDADPSPTDETEEPASDEQGATDGGSEPDGGQGSDDGVESETDDTPEEGGDENEEDSVDGDGDDTADDEDRTEPADDSGDTTDDADGADEADADGGGDGETTDGDSDEEATSDTTGDESDSDNDAETTTSDDSAEPEPDGELEIHHIDVGQSDSTLLVTPEGETILIDTGDWRQDGAEVIAYLESLGIDRIDHLVATHPHADHIGGHAAVIEWAETDGSGIGAAYDSGVAHTTATYEDYLDAIDTHEVELFTVEAGDELPIEDELLDALVLNPPSERSGDELHDNSISLAIEYGEFGYVTTGDADIETERRMVADWGDELGGDVYQVGHHGSVSSSSAQFVETVDPRIAVISSEFDSQYGHPHEEVLERFVGRGIETYWTGVHGTIVVSTDGEAVTVDTDHEFSTDPAVLLDEKPGANDSEGTDDAQDETDGSPSESDEDSDTDAEESDDTADGTGDEEPPTEDESDGDNGSDEDPAVLTDNDEIEAAVEIVDMAVEGVEPDEEYITLRNTADSPLDLGSWQIRDREADGQISRGLSPFTFPTDFELGAGDDVRIWTGEGEDSETDRYWDYGVNIWRAGGDVIILMDPSGEHVLEHPYGDQE